MRDNAWSRQPTGRAAAKGGPSGTAAPTDAEKQLLAEFRERMEARHRAPRVKLDHRPPKPIDITPAEGEPQTTVVARLVAFGTTSTDFYSRTFQELLEAGCPWHSIAAFHRSGR